MNELIGVDRITLTYKIWQHFFFKLTQKEQSATEQVSFIRQQNKKDQVTTRML